MAKARAAGQAQVDIWITSPIQDTANSVLKSSKAYEMHWKIIHSLDVHDLQLLVVGGVFLEIDFDGCGRPRLLTKRARSRPATPEYVPSRAEVPPRDQCQTFTSSFAALRDLSEQRYPPWFEQNPLTSSEEKHCADAGPTPALTQRNRYMSGFALRHRPEIQTCLLDGGPAGKTISEIGISISMGILFS